GREGSGSVASSYGTTTLKRGFISFAGSNADRLLKSEYDDLPVAHLAGSGCLPDGFDHLTEEVVGDRSVNFDFWDECHFVFRTPVDLRITVLPAKTLHFGRRDGLHADGGECLDDPSFTMRPRRLHRNRGPRIRRRDRTPI